MQTFGIVYMDSSAFSLPKNRDEILRNVDEIGKYM